jgi:hypothetical protein
MDGYMARRAVFFVRCSAFDGGLLEVYGDAGWCVATRTIQTFGWLAVSVETFLTTLSKVGMAI